MMNKLLGMLVLGLGLGVACPLALAADEGYHLETAPKRISDLAALQNGAKLFVNYCMGCHSASAMRYNKLTELGLSEEDISRNLLFTSDKVGDLMTIAMTRADAGKWFGAAPPDLSVIARAKSTNLGPSGVDYVYTFLRTFYRDASKKTGWDNAVFPSVGMPHVFWQRQGPVTHVVTHIAPAPAQEGEGHGAGEGSDHNRAWQRTITTFHPDGFKEVKTEALANWQGSATTRYSFQPLDKARGTAYDNDVADLANFLGWMAEPHQQQRKRLGVWVILFLGLFFVEAWRLNAVYWKHVK